MLSCVDFHALPEKTRFSDCHDNIKFNLHVFLGYGKHDIGCPKMCESPTSNPSLLREVFHVRIMIMITLVTTYTTAASCCSAVQ